MSESEVRKMRDEVFEHKSTEEGWAACRENWMRPDSIKWLSEWVTKLRGAK